MARKWRVGLTAMCASVAMVLTACSGGSESGGTSGPSAAPKAGGSLTVGIEASWISFDPLKATSYNSYDVLLTVYEQLFTINDKGEAVPQLAKSFEVSSDGLTYTVKLETGVKFQDGTDFNAEAAKINLDRARDPQNGCTCLGVTNVISSVEAPSADTLVIKLAMPNAGFVPLVLASNAGIMVSPATIAQGSAAINEHPVGTGPFELEKQLSGDSVTVKKWDGYRVKDRPYLDSVTVKVITDGDARYASLQSNAVNVADNVALNLVKEAKTNASLSIKPIPAAGTTFLSLNMGQNSPLIDPKARQAVCMAVDPEAINKTLYDGLAATGQESPFPNGSTYSPGKVEDYPSYDLKKAKQMVKDLGGLTFSLEISSNPANVKLAQALTSQWEAAGMNVTIKQVDQPTLVQQAFAHDFEVQLFRWRGAADPDGNVAPFFPSKLATPDKPSNNYTLVSDPTIDKLITDGQETTDVSARKKIYSDLSTELAKQMPYCYLWAANWYRMTASNVYGLPERADNIMTFADAYVNG